MLDTIVIDAESPEEIATELQRVFEDIGTQLEQADFTVTWTLIIKYLELAEMRLFETEKSPDGSSWAPDRPATVRRKGHDVILHESGRLGASLFGQTGDSVRNIDPHFLTFGTATPYSIFLNEGTRRMPAREHVGVTSSQADEIAEYLADACVVALGGVP